MSQPPDQLPVFQGQYYSPQFHHPIPQSQPPSTSANMPMMLPPTTTPGMQGRTQESSQSTVTPSPLAAPSMSMPGSVPIDARCTMQPMNNGLMMTPTPHGPRSSPNLYSKNMNFMSPMMKFPSQSSPMMNSFPMGPPMTMSASLDSMQRKNMYSKMPMMAPNANGAVNATTNMSPSPMFSYDKENGQHLQRHHQQQQQQQQQHQQHQQQHQQHQQALMFPGQQSMGFPMSPYYMQKPMAPTTTSHPSLSPHQMPSTVSMNANGKRALMEAAPIKDSRPPSKKAKSSVEETEVSIPAWNEFPAIPDDGTKPSLSYAQLIGMAILRSPQRRLTLSQIYKWISDTFSFYNANDAGWQNSIRHNLSLHKAFYKMERPKDDPGKGNYWCIEAGMETLFVKDRPVRKSSSASENMPIMSSRLDSTPISMPPSSSSLMVTPQNLATPATSLCSSMMPASTAAQAAHSIQATPTPAPLSMAGGAHNGDQYDDDHGNLARARSESFASVAELSTSGPPVSTTSAVVTNAASCSVGARAMTTTALDDISSDATIPASDAFEESNGKSTSNSEMSHYSPLPMQTLDSSPPVPRHVLDRNGTPPPPPSSSSSMPSYHSSSLTRSELKRSYSAMDDSGYISSLESSVIKQKPNTNPDADRTRRPQGRAEEEIARLRSSSSAVCETPSAKPKAFVPVSPSPLRREATGQQQLLQPLTPAMKLRGPKPPPSVSPNTNLRLHRAKVHRMLQSPLKKMMGSVDDVMTLPWSPAAAKLEDALYGFMDDTVISSTPEFDIFTDDVFSTTFPSSMSSHNQALSASVSASPAKRGSLGGNRRPRLDRTQSSGPLGDITNTSTSRVMMNMSQGLENDSSFAGIFNTPGKPVSSHSSVFESPSKLFLGPTLSKAGNATSKSVTAASSVASSAPFAAGIGMGVENWASSYDCLPSNEDTGVDILLGFAPIGGSQERMEKAGSV